MTAKTVKILSAVLASVILLTAILLIINKVTAVKDDDAVLTVSGEPVSKAEYLFIMSGLKSDVYSYFVNKYGAEENHDFWTESFSGEVPSAILRKKAFDTLKKIKTEQSLMKKYEIADDISFRGFLKDLKAENERRKNAASLDQPIYGPLQFEERVYYEYLHSERVQKLIRVLAGTYLMVSNDEINAYLAGLNGTQGDKENSAAPDEIKEMIIKELTLRKYEEFISGLSENSTVALRINNTSLNKIEREIFNK